MKILRQNWRILLEALVLGALVFAAKWEYRGDLFFSNFQVRDLARAETLAAGRWIFFGPETSGGGHLPGPFYYLLLAPSFFFGAGWFGAWVIKTALLATSAGLFWAYARARFGFLPAALGFVCLARPLLAVDLAFENPCYVPAFFLSASIALEAAYVSGRCRAAAWIVTCLLASLSMQLHFMGVFPFVAGLLLQAIAPRWGMRRLHAKAFFAGCGVFAAPLLPYFIWRTIGGAGAQAAVSATGVNLFGWSDLLRQNLLIREAGGLSYRFFTLIPMEAFLALALLGTLLTLPWTRRRFAEGEIPASLPQPLIVFSVVAGVSLIAGLFFLYAGTFLVRYAIAFRVALALFLAAGACHAQHRLRKSDFEFAVVQALIVGAGFTLYWFRPWVSYGYPWEFYLVLLLFAQAGAFLLFRRGERLTSLLALIAMFVLIGPVPLARRHSNVLLYDDVKYFAERVREQTGWKYAEARKRFYFVNSHNETALAYVYRDAEKLGTQPGIGTGLRRVDGYFVGRIEAGREIRNTEDFRRWLGERAIEPMVQAAVATGAIRLGHSFHQRTVAAVPFQVMDTEKVPPYFHNRGEGYFPATIVDVAPREPDEPTFLIDWNDGPFGHRISGFRVHVGFPTLGGSRASTAHVTIYGQPLSEASNWLTPLWTQALINPYVVFHCDGKQQRHQLAGSLGFNRERGLIQNATLLAPLERFFRLDCKGKVTKVGFGYERSLVVRSQRRDEELGPRYEEAMAN